MNARSTSFEFTCLSKRINEVISAIIHSVIFNRCFGKFHYEYETSYSIGTLGFEEVFCDFIDFTYIRVSSIELIKTINRNIVDFAEELRSEALSNRNRPVVGSPTGTSPPSYQRWSPEGDQYGRSPDLMMPPAVQLPLASPAASGTINLEFWLKNTNRFSFGEPLVWEVWSLKINCLKDEANETLYNKVSLEEQLFDKMLSIVQIINNHKSFLPQMPSQSELENVFDTRYPDAQPYNFKISYKVGGEVRSSAGTELSGGPQKMFRNIFNKLAL